MPKRFGDLGRPDSLSAPKSVLLEPFQELDKDKTGRLVMGVTPKGGPKVKIIGSDEKVLFKAP